MRKHIVVAVSLLALSCVAASSSAQDIAACTTLTDTAARLECYDKAAKIASPPPTPATTTAPAPATTTTAAPTVDEALATTKEIVAPYAPSDFKLIDPLDLHVAPNKYIGKPIALRGARCFYADKDEYRCMAPGSAVVMIMAPDITPATAKSALEDDCGAVKTAMSSAKCRATLRFVPAKASSDLLNGYTQRIVIVARQIEIAPEEAKRRR